MEEATPPREKKNTKTLADRVFERCLELHGRNDFVYEPPVDGSPKQPDYLLVHGGRNLRFEVKSFDPPEKAGAGSVMTFDPRAPVREKINKAAKQFAGMKGDTCAVVLFNNSDESIFLKSPVDMYGVMAGDPALQFIFDTAKGSITDDKPTQTFSKNGKMRHESKKSANATIQNTTISALIVPLKHPQPDIDGTNFDVPQVKNLGVIVYENPWAAKRFPRDLFLGPWDVIYGNISDKEWGCVHWGSNVIEEMLGRMKG